MSSSKLCFRQISKYASVEDVNLVCTELFHKLIFLELSYPNFNTWFNNKIITGILSGERILLLVYKNNELAGVSILKNTPVEQKICTLYVFPKYQSQGIGVQLFKKSMAILESDKPLLSVSQDRLSLYDKLFAYFGYDFVENYHGLYVPQKNELSFNGLLN